MNTPEPYVLQERILRLLDGEMLAEEISSLDAELRDNPESRAIYIQLAALHSSLLDQYSSSSAVDPSRIISIDRIVSRQRQRLWRFSSLAAAAILLLAAIPLWLKLAGKPAPLATFQTTQDATYELSHSKQSTDSEEQILLAGSRLKLTSGQLEAKFSSGARCVLQAPCEITAFTDRHVRVGQGTAWFHVSPQAKGFVVETRSLHIIDLGTEFGVTEGPDGQDEIHVIKGEVEAAQHRPGKTGRKQLLQAGQARRITEAGELIHTALRTRLFPTSLFQPLAIRNANFDVIDDIPEDHNKLGYGPVPAWASSGAGVGLSSRFQPFLGQHPHSGTHVAFIQGEGIISQSVSGFDPSKLYSITYFVSERGLPDAATRTAVSLDLGSSTYSPAGLIRKTDRFRRIVSGPLHVFGPTANIQISAQTAQGDAALLIDSVGISRAVPAIPDGGFEMTVLPPNQFAQAVQDDSHLLDGSPWKFVGGAGIIHNGSAFATPPVPEGSQAAVIQGLGASMENAFHGFEPGVTYRLHLQAAGRQEGSAELRITLDGTPLRFRNTESLHPTGRKFQSFTSEDFQSPTDSSKLRIESTTVGTTFLDDIHFEFVAEAGDAN